MDKEITQKPLAKLTTNMWAFRTLVASIKLDVFEYIKEDSTAEEVAKKLNINVNPVERLLNALVAMDLVEKRGRSYVNLPISNKFLIKNLPSYYGDFILMAEDSDDSWKELDKSIVSSEATTDDQNERLAKPFFTRAMHNNAQDPARKLSKSFDFSEKKHLLDIGAGAGTFSIVLTNEYPDLRATTIEQKNVCKIIDEYIKKEGDAEKIKVVVGDFFEVDFPKHDIALFGQIFHSNSVEENKKLLRKVYNNIENNGMVIITEFLMNEEKTGPLFSALFSLNMLKQNENGDTYTFSQIKEWLVEIGFKDIQMEHLTGPHTTIIGYKK